MTHVAPFCLNAGDCVKGSAVQETFDAIVLAGYDPDQPDPLTAEFDQPHKALIPLLERPLVWHVVKALGDSPRIGRILVVGMSAADGVDFPYPVDYMPDQGGMLRNAAEAYRVLSVQHDPGRHALLVMSDAPLLTGAIIDWFLDACRPLAKDVYWGIVEQAVMEEAFPTSRRTYLRLVEGHFCSGDLYLGRISAALQAHGPIQTMIEHRKNVFQQMLRLGPNVILRFIFRRLRLADLLAVAQRLVGASGAPVIMPFAAVGMDVDKPHQYRQVLDYMAAHPEEYADRAWPGEPRASSSHG